MTTEGDPTVFSSRKASSPEAPDPLLVRFDGVEKEEKKAGKIGCSWLLLLPHFLLWTTRDLRASFSLWWTLYHYLSSLPHLDQSHSLPQLPGKIREEFFTFGSSVHSNQGLSTTVMPQRQAWELCFVERQHSRSRTSMGTLRRLDLGGWKRATECCKVIGIIGLCGSCICLCWNSHCMIN